MREFRQSICVLQQANAFACMSDDVSIDGFVTAPFNASANQLATQEEYDAAFPADTLLVAASPDSWSFQHFLDRVTCALGVWLIPSASLIYQLDISSPRASISWPASRTARSSAVRRQRTRWLRCGRCWDGNTVAYTAASARRRRQ